MSTCVVWIEGSKAKIYKLSSNILSSAIHDFLREFCNLTLKQETESLIKIKCEELIKIISLNFCFFVKAMSLFITSLNSGSNGNCYYIGNHKEAVLVDVGISCREDIKQLKL